MNNSVNAIDYVVSKKASGSNLIARILLVVLYAAVGIGIIVGLNAVFPIVGIIAGGVLAALVLFLDCLFATADACFLAQGDKLLYFFNLIAHK